MTKGGKEGVRMKGRIRRGIVGGSERSFLGIRISWKKEWEKGERRELRGRGKENWLAHRASS